jgi:broad specificity phosphatase PhoE
MPQAKPATRFGLMRHAQTAWNREKRIQSTEDSELTPAGEISSRHWGKSLAALSWHRIVSSDLSRALKTAQLINRYLKVPITNTPLLREMNWGEWSGKTLRQIHAQAPGKLSEQEQAGWDFRPPGGEDRRSVLNRAIQALAEAAETWTGERILVITHEGVIKCIVYSLMQRRFLPQEPPLLKPEHMHTLIHDGRRLAIEQINYLALKSTV